VELEAQSLSHPLWVQGDEARLGQVMANLLSNAAKFAPQGGSVRIEARVVLAPEFNTKGVQIDVFDGGEGVPKEFESRLFGRFAQADSSATRARGGTGLGLSISRAIIEQHGGILSYHAATTNSEHSFRFVLPLWEPEPPVEALVTARLLVCEDDPEVAEFLAALLGEQGFAVSVASTLSQARVMLQEQQFDALTLDLMLPDGDGIVFLGELRERGQRLPVVVVSAFSEEGRVRGGALDVSDWLQKPLDPARLLGAVARLRCDDSRRARVLHVEDDADVREVTRAILGAQVEVVHAATLEEAREKLALGRFDLALLDIGLPDGDGLELVPLLAAQEPPVPVALFSAQEADGPQGRAVAAALVKSRSTNADLRSTIERLLHLSPDSLSP